MFRFAPALSLMVLVAACQHEPPVREPASLELTAAQRAAYEQCLKDSQAVAMAWSVIEQRCLEQATNQLESAPQ